MNPRQCCKACVQKSTSLTTFCLLGHPGPLRTTEIYKHICKSLCEITHMNLSVQMYAKKSPYPVKFDKNIITFYSNQQ